MRHLSKKSLSTLLMALVISTGIVAAPNAASAQPINIPFSANNPGQATVTLTGSFYIAANVNLYVINYYNSPAGSGRCFISIVNTSGQGLGGAYTTAGGSFFVWYNNGPARYVVAKAYCSSATYLQGNMYA